MDHQAQSPSTALPAVLEFDGAELKVIDRDGVAWLSATDLARALGYSDDRAVTRIYKQHDQEFSIGMVTVVDSTTRTGMPFKSRIFSPRGCHLVAMFSRTARASAFRRWVLDVLEGYNKRAAVPAPVDSTNLLGHLRLTRILFTLDGRGRPQAMTVPDDAGVVRPADLYQWVEDPTVLERDELERVALAALRRVEVIGGQPAIRRLLGALDPNYLLVLENELVLSLYGSPSVYGKLPRGGRDE